MRTSSIILIFAVIFLFSCKKKKETVSGTIDSISYIKFDSTIWINSIVAMTQTGDQHCGPYNAPIPIDTNAFIDFDVDSDKVNDFRIRVHNGISNDFCGLCHYPEYYTSLSALSPSYTIANYVNATGQNCATYFKDGDVISNVGNFGASVYLLQSGTCIKQDLRFNAGNIGFRKNNNFGWIQINRFGSNGVSIYECALNLKSNNSILAGQKK